MGLTGFYYFAMMYEIQYGVVSHVLFTRRLEMSRETSKVFTACAIGAGIGAFVSLEIWAMFWWLGLLVGGLCGYLSYEWREVVKAIPKAFRVATSYRFPKYFLKTAMWQSLLVFSVFSWSVLLLPFVSTIENGIGVVVCIGFLGCLLSLVMAFDLLPVFLQQDSEEKKLSISEERIESLIIDAYLVFLPIVLFWHLPRGIIFLAKRVPRFTVWFVAGCILVAREWSAFSVRFCWELFLRIHSEMRLLCGVDAMFGAGIGYIAGSALIGALAGGVIGVVNYAVITERVLKPLGYISVKNQ